jgi:hypothetical protein
MQMSSSGFHIINRLYRVGDLQKNCDIFDIFMPSQCTLNIFTRMLSLKIIFFPLTQPKLKNLINFYVPSNDAEYTHINFFLDEI